MLERMAREAGLAAPEKPSAGPATTPDLPNRGTVPPAGAVLTELRPSPPPGPAQPLPPTGLGRKAELSGLERGAELSGLEHRAERPELERETELSGLGLAVHALGLPLSACQSVRSVTARDDLETELCRALQLALPPLPSPPQLPTSVVAVIGPREEVMTAARAVAADIGVPNDEIAIATQRPLWRSQERVLGPPQETAEERRTWRWRGRPSVVAIEQPVRAGASRWANEMLRALEPALCWGVAEASHKPEDVAAWSRALGGIDVLALVDLEGTTTPAAALATTIPVGSLDGEPATPQLWASILRARLMG
jgi:hypothetical protein